MKSRQLDFHAIPDGTYLNSGKAAQIGLTINRFCYDLRHPGNRDDFLADRDALMDRYAIAAEDRALIAAKDWLGMVRRGANVFPLLRLAQLCGDNLTATGAQMRGETIEQYLASRQTAGEE